MDIAAEIRSVLPGMRRHAESLMTARCVVRRAAGTTTDPDTWEVTRDYTLVYEGRCKPQTYEAFETTPDVGGATLTVQRSRVDFPVGPFAPEVGDIITITDSRDPRLVGRSYRASQESPVKEIATAYRVFVDENVGEEVPPWPAP